MTSKQNDLMLNILENPQFSIGDFQKVGLSAKNTSLEDESTYLNSELITSNPLFKNASGEFDKVKFHNVYLQAAKGLEQINSEPQDFQAVYSKYNIWAPTAQRENSPGYELVKIANPDRITKSMITIGQNGPREYTPQEIAQSQKVWNSEKQEWMDTPEDMFSFSKLFGDFAGFFSDNFGSTKVMATYDEDVDINGKKRGEVGFDDSQIEHQKGDYMLNDNGTYYYRTLKDGENIYGKQVLHYSDILTREGSALNTVDFLDSDDIQKSPLGSFVKNASLIGSFFLPYVGTAIAGATIFQQAAGLGATLGKIALGSDNSTMNWLEGLSESTNPFNTRSEWSSIDYGNTGRNTTWTIENLLGMVGDVVGQLKQQRLLFEYSPYLLKGKWGINEKNRKLLETKYFEELQQASKGKVLSALEKKDVAKALEASKKLEAANQLKAADMVETYMKDYQKSGEELSKAYMTLLTVNDIYGEAIEAGADNFDAAVITAAYAAMEYSLLSTDIGKWVLPELRGERLQNKAMLHALTKDVRDSFKKLGKAASESDEAKKTYLQKLVDFGKSVAKGEFNVGLGKKAAFKEGSGLLKAGVGSVFSGASAEAVEEFSEELLGDFSRVLFNGLEQLKGKDVRLKPFENAVDRYGMSFLGGFIGGGVSSAMFDFRNAQRTLNMSYDQAMQEIIHKAHNNELDGIYEILNKEEVGNKNLSAKNFDKDEDGNIIWKQGDENDNQDIAIKRIVRNQLQLIENTLNAHGGKTDDEILGINTMRDLRYRALRNTTTAGLFIQKYNETLTDLVKKTEELRKLNTPASKAENGESDKKDSENPDIDTQRKLLEEEIKNLDEKLQEFHSGSKAPLFMATALLESTPFIAQALMPSTFKVYAEMKSGKKFNNISESELKNLEVKYQNYLRTDKKDDLQLATKSYLIMQNLIKGNLESIQDILTKQSEDPIISKFLENTDEIFEGLNFETDEEKWQESFGKWAEGNQALGEEIANQVNLLYNTYRENLNNNQANVDAIRQKLSSFDTLSQQIDDALALDIQHAEENYNNLGELAASSAEASELKEATIKEANKKAKEAKDKLEKEKEDFLKEISDKGYDIDNLEKQKEEANNQSKKDLDVSLQDLIFKTGVKQANNLADRILSQGFVNGAIKNQIIDKLDSMSKTLESSSKQAEDLILKDLVSKGVDDKAFKQFISEGDLEDAEILFGGNPDAKKIIQNYISTIEQYNQAKQELDSKIEQIKKLKYTPIMNILDSFALNLGKGKVSYLLNKLGKTLSSTRQNVSQFTMSDNLYKQISEADRVLDLYIAALEGARTDTVDPFKINVDEKGNVVDRSNIWGINKVINEVHGKSPKVKEEKWEDLPEIEGKIADMMLEDAKRLKNTLDTYKQLYSINQGQKLNVQKRVSAKTNYLLYSKISHLLTSADLPDKEELERKINSLTLLKEETSKDISDWNVNLNKDQEKQLEKERIQMEDALYEYFQDKVDNIETLKKIFNPKNFVMYNDKATLLSEGSEEIDDASFIGYLAVKAALKSSAFQNKFKDILRDGTIAPLIGQEISVQLGLANILKGEVVTNIIKAYRSSLLEMSSEQRKEFLTKAGYSPEIIEAYSTESGIKLFVNDNLVPQYDNVIFVDGIPGAGKSAAVDALIYKYLKTYHPEINAWVSHGGDTEGGKITKEFAKNIGFGESFEGAYDKITLMKNIFPDYNPKEPDNFGQYSYTTDDYELDADGKIQVKWKIDGKWTKENVPKVIFIDEAQQFSQLELLAIDKFAKKFGIAVVMSGDLNQSQMHASININETIKEINREAGKELLPEIKKGEKNNYSISLTRNQVLHTPKLGTSMRTSNNQKNVNMANTEVIMSKGAGDLELHYYEDEQTLAGDYQLRTLSVDDIKPWIDKMIPLLKEGEKIHFALPKGDPFKEKLQAIEKYNKIIQFHDGVGLGQEGQFWIVKFSDVNSEEFKQDFYTGQTRSQQFSLMLVPDTVYNGKIKITNIKDQESHKEEYSRSAIKKYSDDHVKLLDEILPKEKEEISYTPRKEIEDEPSIEKPTGKPVVTMSSEEKIERRKKLIKAAEGILPLEETSEDQEDKDSRSLQVIIETPDGLPSGELNNIKKEVEENSELYTDNQKKQVLKLFEFLNKLKNAYSEQEAINILDKGINDESLPKEIRDILQRNYDKIIQSINEYFKAQDFDIFEEVQEPSPDEISLLEDLSVEEAKDKLDEDNGVITESDSQKDDKPSSEEFSLNGFRFYLFSNSTFELGTANVDRNNNTYELESQYRRGGWNNEPTFRIDGVNGIENPAIKDPEWVNIRNTKNLRKAEEKLGYIRRLLMSQNLDKPTIARLIASNMGIDGGVYIRYAIKTSSFDTDFDETSEGFKKLEKSKEEELHYARAQRRRDSESNTVNNRNLVAIIGTNSKGDIIEIPLMNFNNPVTIIRSLEEDHPIRILFEEGFRNTDGEYGEKQRGGLNAVISEINGKPEYKGLTNLISLYLATYRHVLFIPDQNWTPRSGLESLGVQFNNKRGIKKYDDADYIQTRQYNYLDELRQDPSLHRISAPMHLANKDGKVWDNDGEHFVKIANPKHPFILYTDQTHNHKGQPINTDDDLISEFLWQQFNDVPKTIQLMYILPPQFELEEYLNTLVDFMTGKGGSPFGNQRTAYKILEGIFMADVDNNFKNVLQCFQNALGKEDGEALFYKTLSVIRELANFTKDGEVDIQKQVKVLTTRTESWDLGNVGIPKEIPLYRQLQNVLKQLVHPQSVVLEEGEDGMQIYVSRVGTNRMRELLPPLQKLFDKSGVTLYHQTVGAKSDRSGQFVKIQTDDKGHFTNGEDFQTNGSIASQAFETTDQFNHILDTLVHKINYEKRGNGWMIKTSDNWSYINGHSGWTRPDYSTGNRYQREAVVPTIHNSIIKKLERLYDNTEIENIKEIVKDFIKNPNDKSPELLQAIANIINKNNASRSRAVVINGELLIGESPHFKNKQVEFLQGQRTTRGYELEVTIGEQKFDGTFINGELTLQSQITQSASAEQTNTIDYDKVIKYLAENPATWGITNNIKRNAVSKKLNNYIQNPTPENLSIIQQDRAIKNLLKTFEEQSTNNNITQEQRNCSFELKIKFN